MPDDKNALYQIDLNELIKLGATTADVSDERELLYAVVPEGYELKTHDMSKRNEEIVKRDERIAERKFELENERPMRNVGDVRVADVESFAYMVERENIPETTIVRADMNNRNFVAIINFAEDGKIAGFEDRTISLSLVRTLEFGRWMANNRERMTQLQLADFLEENLENIVEPPAAEMIEMISNLKVKRNAQYHSVIDTNTGAQSLSFSETIKGETVNGSMDFRSKFKIAITPYIGSKPYEIECNVRFSVGEERLRIFFNMINIAKIEEHAFDAENTKVRDAMGKLGAPVINIR
jgi:uncharacterized protein YfdQ (DUF2303 family)